MSAHAREAAPLATAAAHIKPPPFGVLHVLCPSPRYGAFSLASCCPRRVPPSLLMYNAACPKSPALLHAQRTRSAPFVPACFPGPTSTSLTGPAPPPFGAGAAATRCTLCPPCLHVLPCLVAWRPRSPQPCHRARRHPRALPAPASPRLLCSMHAVAPKRRRVPPPPPVSMLPCNKIAPTCSQACAAACLSRCCSSGGPWQEAGEYGPHTPRGSSARHMATSGPPRCAAMLVSAPVCLSCGGVGVEGGLLAGAQALGSRHDSLRSAVQVPGANHRRLPRPPACAQVAAAGWEADGVAGGARGRLQPAHRPTLLLLWAPPRGVHVA